MFETEIAGPVCFGNWKEGVHGPPALPPPPQWPCSWYVFAARCTFSLRTAHYHYYQKSLKRWCTNSFWILDNYLNDLLCGFRKAHSTQHILPRLIQSLKKGPDNSGLVGTILLDLSKAYDCLPRDLSVAKLKAYGLDKTSLNLVNGYLGFWKQRKKTGSSYSDWANVLRVFPRNQS